MIRAGGLTELIPGIEPEARGPEGYLRIHRAFLEAWADADRLTQKYTKYSAYPRHPGEDRVTYVIELTRVHHLADSDVNSYFGGS